VQINLKMPKMPKTQSSTGKWQLEARRSKVCHGNGKTMSANHKSVPTKLSH